MSFTDLISSSRGPGVIGTVIAFVVLVGFAVLYFMVFDESMQGGQKTIGAMIREQESAIASAQSRIESLREKEVTSGKRESIAREVSAMEQRTKAEAAQKSGLAGQVAALGTELKEIEEKWESYKDDYRAQVWKEAEGQLLKEFKTLSGKTYTDAKVLGVDHTGMRVMVSSGPVNIKSEDLPDELKELYQLSEAKKQAILTERDKGTSVHEENVAVATRLQRIADLNVASRDKNAAKLAAQQKLQGANEAGPRHQMEISRQEGLIRAEKGKPVSHAPQLQQQLQQMRKKAEETRNSIPKLQEEVRKIDDEIAKFDAEVKTLTQEIQKLRSEAKPASEKP